MVKIELVQIGSFIMSKKLEGKVAIVTGASKGIGASVALQFAKEGAHVVVNYNSSKEEANYVVNRIVKNGGKAIAIQANMAKEQDIRRLFEESEKAFGKIDILVNNAGIYESKSLEDITSEHFYKMFDLNVLGLIFASQEAAKYFRQNGGSIINISSVAATTPSPAYSVYSGTKAAVDALTRSLAAELGPRNIRVNSINPGMVKTEGLLAAGIDEGDFRKHVEATTPLGRIGQPEDISPACVFLASDDSSWITGQTLHIAGGYR